MRITIRVLPRSSKNEVVDIQPDGNLKVKLTAPPVDGAANAALAQLLSKHFGVAKNKITILKGLRGKTKLVEIAD